MENPLPTRKGLQPGAGLPGDRKPPGAAPPAGAKKLAGATASALGPPRLSALRGPFRPRRLRAGQRAVAQHVFPPWHDPDAHPCGPCHLGLRVVLPGTVAPLGRVLGLSWSAPARGGSDLKAYVLGRGLQQKRAGSTTPLGVPGWHSGPFPARAHPEACPRGRTAYLHP